MKIGISLPSTARHLNILRFNHLVTTWQETDTVYYTIAENEQTQGCPVLKNKPNIKLSESNST